MLSYVKNQGLGLEVPYLTGSTPHKYIPDFIVQVDDGRQPDPLNLIVEVKGYRGEDAKDKANTMRSYWVPGVNNLEKFGRWAFAEFTAGGFHREAQRVKQTGFRRPCQAPTGTLPRGICIRGICAG